MPILRKRAELVACSDEDDVWDVANASKVCAAGELAVQEDADQPTLSKSELAAQRIAIMRQGAAARHRAVPGRVGKRGGCCDEAKPIKASDGVGDPDLVDHSICEQYTGVSASHLGCACAAGATLALGLFGALAWLVLGQNGSSPQTVVRNVVKRVYISQPDDVDAAIAPPPPLPPSLPTLNSRRGRPACTHSRTHFPQGPPSPPPLPQVPPSPPAPKPPPPGAVARLNEMFRSGRATNSLSSVGIIVHGFDAMEDPLRPWRPCPADGGGCAALGDRLSTSIVNGAMHQPHDGAFLPLFGCDNGGLIMRGSSNRLLCSYPGDGGTRGVVCNGESGCIPGCIMPGYSSWCDQHVASSSWCDGKPWPPSKLSQMLGLFMQAPGEIKPTLAYNEVVLDAHTWGRNLPRSVLAIFYPEHASGEGAYFARSAHKKMLEEYPHLTEDDIPLLVLRLNDWETPFDVAPDGTIDDSYTYDDVASDG